MLFTFLSMAVLFGLALCKVGEKARPFVSMMETASYALFGMVNILMRFAPLGAAGAMAFTIGKYGLGTLLQLGQLVAAVYVVSILFVVIVLGGFLRMAGFSLWKVLSYFKDEILVVFAATSAETMIPRSMAKLEHLGVRKEVVGLVMPTGFSFNMDGTAIAIFPDRRAEFRNSVKAGLDYAEAVGVKMVHAMAGVIAPERRSHYHWDCYVENLGFAAHEGKRRGIRMIVEPWRRARLLHIDT